MKRGAERQLTKDGPDDDDNDIEEVQGPHGFQKADESTLAGRQIRALPKRALVASRPSLNGMPPAPAPAPDADKVEAIAPPKFGGFVGFGAGSLAPSSFTFTAPPPPTFAPALSSDTAFKPPQSTPVLGTNPVSPFFGGPTSTSLDADASPSSPTASSLAEEMDVDAMAFKYFKSLRGLNVSFLSAISAAVDEDPFFDVANLVESYKNLRTTIQSEFDGSSQPSTTHGSATTTSNSIFGARAPSEKTSSLFGAVKSFSGSAEASSKLPSASESGAKTSGFMFSPFVPPSSSTSTQLPFSLLSKPSETTSSTGPPEPKSTFTFASKTSTSMPSVPPTSGFSVATITNAENAATKSVRSSSQETEGSSAISLSRPASTAPSFGSSSVPNFFATTKPTNAFGTSDASKPTSVFGGSIFGGSSTTEPNASKTTTTLFGNTTFTTSTSVFASSDKPTALFGSASPPKTGTFTFGKSGGSIGNPVGFGFGNASHSAGDTATSSSPSPGFDFGAPSVKPVESLFSPPATDKSTESSPQPDAEGNEEGGEEDTTRLLPSHTHDEEGEGEEDEETMHVVRCKAYRLTKLGDKNEWRDLGIGMFRLKKHKTTNVRRALMRNSNTGRILVNFRIYRSLKLSVMKNAISFIGYENSTPTSFRIRVKTEEQAGELKQALEREVTAIQAAE